ncbi:MAG TPA: aminotransferase class I/II-fold pyridoxal phosphate-dependent enzyme [Kiritimatiellia bacterium]|nr:aminotransferase class I/II-fold pyridoxal phosphate-dependent enzyme [Kiritimatiellia bacterium]HRZ12626.1 aminotransferase class I/II-fold pyridoxal phosphate-dependent enzyme [Kiritimatiellia bacterium]HSA17704.1 aminotransferase class I/II-fold pyridoxal phosphate-dependent enzyme [Kiritimatiellia bacterium]
MPTNDSKSPRDFIAGHIVDMPRSGIRDFFDIVSTMKDIISLGIGEPDFDTPWHVREYTVFALERGATHYTSNMGLLELRRAISKYVEKAFRASYKPETEILITVGVSEALDLALRATLNPGDEVLYHEPCYVSYRSDVILAHGTPVTVETKRDNQFRLTRAMLEAKATPRTKVLLLNFPNNPTGAILRKEDLVEIAAFARERNLLVITDEIYAELTYDGEHTSIASLPGMKERTIFLHGFSKAWAMTGFRLGYACAPPELTEAMMKVHQYTMLCAPTMSQKAAIEALTKPQTAVVEMTAEYRRRRNYLVKSFEEMGLPCTTPAGAFYAFPYIGHLGIASKDFALKFLDREKVAVVPGTAFGACGEGFVRCAYATSMENIQEAMRRMARFVQSLKKG